MGLLYLPNQVQQIEHTQRPLPVSAFPTHKTREVKVLTSNSIPIVISLIPGLDLSGTCIFTTLLMVVMCPPHLPAVQMRPLLAKGFGSPVALRDTGAGAGVSELVLVPARLLTASVCNSPHMPGQHPLTDSCCPLCAATFVVNFPADIAGDLHRISICARKVVEQRPHTLQKSREHLQLQTALLCPQPSCFNTWLPRYFEQTHDSQSMQLMRGMGCAPGWGRCCMWGFLQGPAARCPRTPHKWARRPSQPLLTPVLQPQGPGLVLQPPPWPRAALPVVHMQDLCCCITLTHMKLVTLSWKGGASLAHLRELLPN
jgi:hypothetical protein